MQKQKSGQDGHVFPETANPLVSIIIRTRDRPRTLAAALRSVEGQTYRPLEVVVVNDGGTPVAETLQDGNSGIRMVVVEHASSHGRAAAANSGIQAATGFYLNFLDDDDVLYPEHVSKLVAALEAGQNQVAYAGVRSVVFSGTPDAPGEKLREEIQFNETFDPVRLLFENYIPFMSAMFRRSVLDDGPWLDPALDVFEDWDFWLRLSRKYPFWHIDIITSEYRFYDQGDIESAHRSKYAYEEGLATMFERALPYLNGQAWLWFHKFGSLGRLLDAHQRTQDELDRLRRAHATLDGHHQQCTMEFEALRPAYATLGTHHQETMAELDRQRQAYATLEMHHRESMAELDRQRQAYATLEMHHQESSAELERLRGVTRELELAYLDKVTENAAREQELAKTQEQIASIKRSLSWRSTRPLRFLASFFWRC